MKQSNLTIATVLIAFNLLLVSTAVAEEVRTNLIALQEGRAADPHGWLHFVP